MEDVQSVTIEGKEIPVTDLNEQGQVFARRLLELTEQKKHFANEQNKISTAIAETEALIEIYANSIKNVAKPEEEKKIITQDD